MDDTMEYSAHATQRRQRRGLTECDISYVMRHGRRFHVADAVVTFLGDKDVPAEDARTHSRLCGTAVVVSRTEPLVITVWRNRHHGMRHIKRKPKAGWRVTTGA